MRANQFRVPKQQYGFSEKRTRWSLAGTSSVYDSGVVYMHTDPTETLEAERAYVRWLGVMACVRSVKNGS